MSTTNTFEYAEYESFKKWFGLYLVFAVVTAHIAYLAIYPIIKETSHSALYKELANYIATIALPYILINLVFSLARFKMKMSTIVLKVAASSGLSLAMLSATSEVRSLSSEDTTFILLSLGLFSATMLLWDVCRNVSVALPGMIQRIFLVGSDGFVDHTQKLLADSGNRFQLVGVLRVPGSGESAAPSKGWRIFETAKSLKADKVAISLTEKRGVFPLKEMLYCKLSGIEVLDGPGIYERLTGKLLIEDINPSWFIFCEGFKNTAVLSLAKRLMDIFCSVAGLALTLPFAPLVALAIKLDSPGPILFRQERVGQGDRPFVLYKLRTMRQDAERGTGAVWASKTDSRVTRLGRFLRKARIDEIPQLINVLKGEMSLVGPRPERPEFVAKLKEIIPYYSERHFVKPGVTGWAQVRYPYGASVEDALEKLRYDLYYIKNISLLMDVRIIFITVAVVLLCRGAR